MNCWRVCWSSINKSSDVNSVVMCEFKAVAGECGGAPHCTFTVRGSALLTLARHKRQSPGFKPY